jgi:hypothetical protein
LTLQDIIVFVPLYLAFGFIIKKRVFQGLALYSHKWLGIGKELLGAKV